MLNNVFKIMTAVIMVSCLSLGCASAVSTDDQNENTEGSGTSETEVTENISYCTGDECKEEEEFLKTGYCPNVDYAACRLDNPKIRKYCDMDPNHDTYEKVVEEECEDICKNGVCLTYSDNSCENPYIVPIDGSASGSTNSGTNYEVDQTSCSGKLKSMKAVFKVTIPEIGFYKFVSTNSKGTNWGNILTPTCELKNEITSACDIKSTDAFSVLLTPGDYYFFAAPALIFSEDFDAQVTVRKVSYEDVKLCGAIGAFNLIEFKNGEYSVSGDTANGSSTKTYSDLGCSTQGSGGKEIVYMFSARKGQKVNAVLNVTSQENLPDSIALYIAHCKDGSNNNKRCSETKAVNGTVSISLDIQETGEYLLYVDSNTSNKDYQYDLTINLQ